MSSISKKVTIDKKLTLLDLNENVTNFNMKFSLNSENMKDIFYMVITTQDDLDEGKEMEFKQVDGEISGEFSNYDNKYKNYILCLKSDSPVEVNVATNIEIIPDVVPYDNNFNNNIQSSEENYSFNNNSDKTENSSSRKWKIIISIVILFAGIGVIYYFSRKTTDSTVIVSNNTILPIESNILPVIETVNTSMPLQEMIKYSSSGSSSSSSSSSSSGNRHFSCSPTTGRLINFLMEKK
jgi:hypothetical protein